MTRDAKTKPDLAELSKEVEAAMAAHQNAERLESNARNATTAALNRLNEAQRALDRAVEAWRKDAPRDSDWHRQSITMVPA